MGQATSRSWKQGGPRADAVPEKATRRWAVTLLATTLIVILGLVLWSLFKPQAKAAVLVLAPSEFDALEPPLEFIQEDLAWTATAKYVERRPFPDFNPDQVASDLRKLNVGEADTLIVYVAANGVSDADGPAFIISGGRKRPVEPFLTAIARSSARVKLVVMDCQRLQVDTRRGLYPNRFAEDLEKQVRKLSGNNVFLLTTGRPEDVTSILPSPEIQRSLFGKAFEHAVRESSKGQQVTLGQLLDTFKAEMARYLKRASVSQVPKLYELGRGEAAKDRLQIALSTVSLPQPKPEEPPQSKDAKKDDDGKKAKPKAEEAVAEKEKPKPVDPFRSIDEAWRVRDKLQSPATAHSPVVFAPHIWREVQATLADLELRLRSGAATRAESDTSRGAAEESRTIAQELADLDRVITQGGPIRTGSRGAMGRLVTAWSDYQADNRSFARWRATNEVDEKLDQDAFRAYAQAVAELPWTIDLADQLQVRGIGIAGELDLRLVLSAIGDFQRLVLVPSDGRPSDAVLSDLRDRLNSARSELRKPFFQVALDATAEAVDGKINLREQRILDAVLRSPLWSLADRKRFRTALLAPTEFSEHVSAADVNSGSGGSRALEGKAHVDLLSHLRELLEGDQQGDLDVRLLALHEDRLPMLLQAGGIADRLPAWKIHQLLTFVDPRDAEEYLRVERSALPITLPPRERWEVAWSPPTVEIAAPRKPVTVFADIEHKRGEPRNKVPLVVKFDPAMTVRHGAREIENGATIPVPLVDGKARVTLQVDAKGIQPDGSLPGQLRVNIADGEVVLAEGRLDCRLPTERRIELIARSSAFPRSPSARAGETLEVPLYPNREMPWQFQLANRSKNPRTVSVQFFALPPSAVKERPGELTPSTKDALIEQGFPLRTGVPFQEVAGITLQPNEVRDLSPPPMAPKEGEAPAPAAAPADPAATPRFDVSPGMVCVVREAGAAGLPDIYWIGWEWLKPRDYLTVSGNFFSQRPGNLRVRVEPRDGEIPLPPGLDKTGIRVRGRVDRTEDFEGSNPAEEGLNAELTDKNRGGEVLTDLPVGNVKRRFVLDVDGWPRAFVFDVDCAMANNPVDVQEIRQARSSALISWVQVDGQVRQYHPQALPEWRHEMELLQLAEPPKDGALPPEPVLLSPDLAVAAFKQGRLLTVGLEVDLPEARQAGDQMVLRKRPAGAQAAESRTRQIDREYTCELTSYTDGVVTFATRVEDLKVQWPIIGRKGRDELSLALNGNTESKLDVVFDSQPPEVSENGVRTRPTNAASFEVEVNLQDPGGAEVDRTEIFLVNDKQLGAADKGRVARRVAGETWSASFPVPKLMPDTPEPDTFVFIRAIDRAGNEMARASGPHPIRIPRPAAKAGPKPVAGKPKARITGKVQFGAGVFLEGITVKLSTGSTTTTNANGEFEFKGLDPAVKYSLTAEGDVQGKTRTGELKEVEATPEGKPADPVIIKV